MLLVGVLNSADPDILNISASNHLAANVVVVIQPLWFVELGYSFKHVRLETAGNLGADMPLKPDEAFVAVKLLQIELLRLPENF